MSRRGGGCSRLEIGVNADLTCLAVGLRGEYEAYRIGSEFLELQPGQWGHIETAFGRIQPSAGSGAAEIVLIENSTTQQNLDFASGQKKLLVNHTSKRRTNHTAFSNPYLLPTLNITLYETLVVDLPRSGNALERIRDDRDYVNYVVEELSAMIPDEEIRQTSCLDIKMIYRVSYQ